MIDLGWGRYRREWSMAAVLALLLAMLAIFAPRFFGSGQLRGEFIKSASILVAAVGMTMVIVCRQIDISIGSQLSVCAIVAGLSAKSGFPMPAVIVIATATGALLGACNGALVAFVGMPSIVATLATMVVWRESLRWLREGEMVQGLSQGFQWFGLGQTAGEWIVIAAALAIFLICAWSSRNLAAGRAIYAAGSDPEAARLAGLRPKAVTFGVFVAMGALTGIAALLNAVRFPQVQPNLGDGTELQVIAAVVVGGAAINGGRGTLVGSLIGVALLGMIGPALVFFGAEAQWEKAIQGLIILAAVASDTLFRGEQKP